MKNLDIFFITTLKKVLNLKKLYVNKNKTISKSYLVNLQKNDNIHLNSEETYIISEELDKNLEIY